MTDVSSSPEQTAPNVWGAVKNRRILRFAGVGAISTVIDIVMFNLLLAVGLNVYWAGGLGFFAGFTNGYFMNSRFVFKKYSRERYIKYLVVSVIGLLLTELILDIAHVRYGIGENPAKLLAVAVVFVWNYGMSRVWAFR